MLDTDLGADQVIERVLHRFEWRQGCHLGGLGDELWGAADVSIETGFDCLELIQQPFNSCTARKIHLVPILARILTL